MRELTNRQGKILGFIEDFILREGFSPTVREIADYFKMTAKAAQDHKLALIKKGYITIKSQKARTITIKEKQL